MSVVEDPVRAAGVVVLRDANQEFLAVHRPHRSDWSLPKGKIESSEHLVAAAIRECDEETGYGITLESPLGVQNYISLGKPKSVHYWRAHVRTDAGFAPDDEVDEIRWVPVAEATSLLTYPADAEYVNRACALPETSPLILLRHAKAMKRANFDGTDDRLRPLSGRGRTEAKALISVLDAYAPRMVHSSSARRCLDTVRPFAKRASIEVTQEDALTEAAHSSDPSLPAQRFAELLHLPEPLVVCAHRPVLPTLLKQAAHTFGFDPVRALADTAWDPRLAPAAFIVFHRAFDESGNIRLIAAEQHLAPER